MLYDSPNIPQDMSLKYKDGKYIIDIKFSKADSVTIDQELDEGYSFEWSDSIMKTKKKLIIDFSEAKITQSVDFEQYVKWHVLHHGLPGGGHEADRLSEWLGTKIEIGPETIREIAKFYSRARVVFDD